MLPTITERKNLSALERVLNSYEYLPYQEIEKIDLEGWRMFKLGSLPSALFKKAQAGRGFELLKKHHEAGLSFDRGSSYAHQLHWEETSLLLILRASWNYNQAFNLSSNPQYRASVAYSLVKVAKGYLFLGQRKEAGEYLILAEHLFSLINKNLPEYPMYKRLVQALKNH